MLAGLKPTPVQLVTPLSRAECAQRLSAAIDGGSLLRSAFGSKPVIGHASESALQLRKRIGYRNSFQTVLRASLQPDGQGTRISGKAGMHPVVPVFLLLWLGVVGVFGIVLAVGALSGSMKVDGPALSNGWVAVAMPAVMFAFGLVLLWFGRRLARDEARFLTDFLIATLDARAQG